MSTPSLRAKTKLQNPEIQRKSTIVDHKFLVSLKNVFGSLVPYLLIIYPITLLASSDVSYRVLFMISSLVFIYIVIDKFCINREIKIFKIGGDTWIWIFMSFVVISVLINLISNFEITKDKLFLQGLPDFLYIEVNRLFVGINWIFALYLLTYAFTLFPGINRYINILIFTALVVSIFSIVQHYSGIHISQLFGKVSGAYKFGETDGFQVIGFYTHHLKYATCFSFILCFVVAKLLLGNFSSIKKLAFLVISFVFIASSMLWSYARGPWIATVVAILAMSLFVSKRIFVISVLSVSVICGSIYFLSPSVQKRANSIVDMEYQSNYERIEIWNKHMKAFYENPIFGVGIKNNRKLSGSHAHNIYIELMSATGLVGLISYLLLILTFLFISYELLLEIPKNNINHRSFVLGALGTQVVLHIAGLTDISFLDSQINRMFIFIIAILLYINHCYKKTVIQEDNQL